MSEVFQKAKAFIYKNARPLDLFRWQYHFEGGSKDAVINALAYYQNEDGGFGHGLEPDAWNPKSSPMQTWAATEIIREIDLSDCSHSMIKGILRYLSSGKHFNGEYWHNIIPSNNDYPHAPWWHASSNQKWHDDYNPTACLAGFIIRHADKNSTLYNLGCRIAKEAVSTYFKHGLLDNMHTVSCYIRLMQYAQEAGANDVLDLDALRSKLIEQVSYSITKDTSRWNRSYVCKPSQFFSSPESVFYPSNKETAEFECEFIVNTQLEDGSWNITWQWDAYPEEWAVAKNWWKSQIIIGNLLYLKEFKRI
ncbi:MAG TPA: hypothetical protein GX739_01580 [Firmicutes bacterium]|nr:hypothetical protein [Bacillota bacterium]